MRITAEALWHAMWGNLQSTICNLKWYHTAGIERGRVAVRFVIIKAEPEQYG